MKIAFIPANVSGVVFYRVWQFVQAINRTKRDAAVCWWWAPDQYKMHPWEWEINDVDHGLFIKREINAACAWADVVVWMGLHTPMALAFFHKMRAIHDKPFVTEMDDYVFSIPEANAASESFKPGSSLLAVALEQIKASDALIVSTPFLAGLYKPFNPRTYTVENAVDSTLWRAKRTSPGRQRVTIGWVGGATHQEDFKSVAGAMTRILDKYENVRFKFLHGTPPITHERVFHDTGFRAINRYPAWVSRQGFDIGMAPLVDNNFNRAKSNLRWLEYSAMGIPTVASPLPHFEESIRQGETGLIADGEQEWFNALSYLTDNEEARLRIGRQAKEEVKKKWNPDLLGRKYRDVLREIINASSYQERFSKSDRGLNRRSERHALV